MLGTSAIFVRKQGVHGGWRSLSRITAVVTLACAAAMLTLSNTPPTKEEAPAASSDGTPTTPEKAAAPKMAMGKALGIGFRTPKLLLVYASTALITPTFDLTTLLPMCKYTSNPPVACD